MHHLKLICRLCTRIKFANYINIFDPQYSKVKNQVEKIMGVRLIQHKYLPQSICYQCLEDLKQANVFRLRCIKVQKFFKTVEYQKAVLRIIDEENVDKNSVSLNEEEANQDSVEDAGYDNDEIMKEEINIIVEPSNGSNNCQESSSEYDIIECELYNADDLIVLEKNLVKDDSLTLKEKSSRLKTKRKLRGNVNQFVCDQCGCNFINRNHFETHLNRHQGVKPFECEFCLNKFLTKSELKRHVRIHTGERPYACKYCDRRFICAGKRRDHEKSHKNERPHSCAYCEKTFRTKSVLNSHILVHTKERPFSCVTCKAVFGRREHLKVHNRSATHKLNVNKLQNSNETESQ